MNIKIQTSIFRLFSMPSALLHKVNTSCGRPLVSFIFGAILLSAASCSHEEPFNPMPQYYQESRGLINTNVDSIHRFRGKFQGYLRKVPEAVSDELYNPTVINMHDAYAEFGLDLMSFGVNVYVLVDYRWKGDTTIYFD